MAEHNDDAALNETDLVLLGSLREGNLWLRSLLCTLARRGLALKRDEPKRASALLDNLASYPVYKAGQFLFDLMEWEDFMLDGPAPPLLSTALDPRALQRLTRTLNLLRAQLDGETDPNTEDLVLSAATVNLNDADLPPLQSSQYLYQFVVLGVWLSLERTGSNLATL